MPDKEPPAEVGATAPAADPHASTFARVGLLMYAVLISYASLYPFSQWRDMGLPFWSFLLAPLPHYWTGFDVATNVVGYLPLGMLAVFALYPAVRGVPAALLALLAGGLLSGAMEAIQTFLPNRVSSNLDLLTNVGGTLLGALAGLLLRRTFFEQGRLLQWRRTWFIPDAGRGLIMVGLWPLAQIYPQGYLLGLGHLLPLLSDWSSQLLDHPVDLAALLRHDRLFDVQDYWLAESVIAACGLTGARLMLSCTVRRRAPRALLMLGLAAAAATVKALVAALAFGPDNAFGWLTPGARGGLLLGTLMVGGLAYAPPAAQRRIAAVCLLIGFAAVNLAPVNPYFSATLQAWMQGKFINFNGAAHFLSLCWPFFALWFLLHPMHRSR